MIGNAYQQGVYYYFFSLSTSALKNFLKANNLVNIYFVMKKFIWLI